MLVTKTICLSKLIKNMLDELYDDVLSISVREGFIQWLHRNHGNRVSPFVWCYSDGGDLIDPIKSPKGLNWLGMAYDHFMYNPRNIMIDSNGYISPTNDN
jgi:hypothetical protein